MASADAPRHVAEGFVKQGVTVFLTSHVLEIVERLCTHVGIIHRGRLVAQGSVEELRAGVEARAADLPLAAGGSAGREAHPGADLPAYRGRIAQQWTGIVVVRLGPMGRASAHHAARRAGTPVLHFQVERG